MAKLNYTSSEVSALFKSKYGKLSENVYNSANVLLGRMKKQYDFDGKEKKIPVPVGFQGGVGSGTLPTANPFTIGDATLTRKKVYATCLIDRETMKAAGTNEGAFVDATKFTVQKTVEAWTRNASRILFGNGDGVLGVTTAANAGGTATAPTVVISAASWKEANFEENDYIMLNSSNNAYSVSNMWEITAVAPSTRTLTLSRVTGAVDLTGDAAAKTLYLQGSKDVDPAGLKLVCDAASSTLYGITVGRRWQAYQDAAAGAGIGIARLNAAVLGIQKKCGKVPDMIVASFKQFEKILNLLEDQKQYIVEPRSSDLQGKISFKGISFMSSAGEIGIFPERFVEDDRIYVLNSNYITAHHAPDFGWFDDDGTVFLREASDDAYGARYGSYYENLIIPTFQGVITGLAT